MTDPATHRPRFTRGPDRTAEVLQTSTARHCVLVDNVTNLRDELNGDPMAHDHRLTSGVNTDCLGCIVAARLTGFLEEDQQ